MGYAGFRDDVLLEYGVKSFSRGISHDDLLTEIQQTLTRLLRERRPRVLVLEKNNFSRVRMNAGLALAVARMRSTARRERVRLVELDARTVRKVLCNDGNATRRDLGKVLAAGDAELRVHLRSDRKYKVRFHSHALDAVAIGRAYNVMYRSNDPRVRRLKPARHV